LKPAHTLAKEQGIDVWTLHICWLLNKQLLNMNYIHMSSTTRADAPPPPLQTAPTPYFPFFCFSTCM